MCRARFKQDCESLKCIKKKLARDFECYKEVLIIINHDIEVRNKEFEQANLNNKIQSMNKEKELILKEKEQLISEIEETKINEEFEASVITDSSLGFSTNFGK